MIKTSGQFNTMPTENNQNHFSVKMGAYLSEFIHTQLDNAQKQLARRGLSRHEGIHEARKCIRRAKSALAIGRDSLGDRATQLHIELGRICHGLSSLRDAQAIIEALRRLNSSAYVALKDILPMAEIAACQYRDQLLAKALVGDPQFKRRRQRLLRLSEKLVRLDWGTIEDRDIKAAIKRSIKRHNKAGKKVRQNPEDDALWHDYRRRLRRLRQQAHLLSAAGLDIGILDMRFNAQTKVLGEAQDDVLLVRFCGRHSPFPAQCRQLLRTVSQQRLYNARGKWLPRK